MAYSKNASWAGLIKEMVSRKDYVSSIPWLGCYLNVVVSISLFIT